MTSICCEKTFCYFVRNEEKTMKKIISAALCVALSLSVFGCKNEKAQTSSSIQETPTDGPIETTTQVTSEETSATSESTSETQAETTVPDEETSLLKGYPMFTLTSDDLKNGFWPDDCGHLPPCKDLSPALSWEPVEGASVYVIYMVDPDANNWLHWKQNGITDTKLPQGFGGSDYVGPYPPGGATHHYDIYVVALKKQLAKVKGALNAKNIKHPDFMQALDTDDDGNTGNIIAYGRITGLFTGK